MRTPQAFGVAPGVRTVLGDAGADEVQSIDELTHVAGGPEKDRRQTRCDRSARLVVEHRLKDDQNPAAKLPPDCMSPGKRDQRAREPGSLRARDFRTRAGSSRPTGEMTCKREAAAFIDGVGLQAGEDETGRFDRGKRLDWRRV